MGPERRGTLAQPNAPMKNPGQTLFAKESVSPSMNPLVSGPIIAGISMNVPTVLEPTQLLNASKSNLQDSFPKTPTPLRILPGLGIYPDLYKAKILYVGFKVGFEVPEFEGPGCTWVNNSKSVILRNDIVKNKINSEIAEGRIADPSLPHLLPILGYHLYLLYRKKNQTLIE